MSSLHGCTLLDCVLSAYANISHCLRLIFILFISFISCINEATVYILMRKGTVANRELPNGEVDRCCGDSNQRRSHPEAVILSACPPELSHDYRHRRCISISDSRGLMGVFSPQIDTRPVSRSAKWTRQTWNEVGILVPDAMEKL